MTNGQRACSAARAYDVYADRAWSRRMSGLLQNRSGKFTLTDETDATNERAGTSFKGGSRFYTFDDGVQHPGVTSILNMLPKPFLGPWQAKMAAVGPGPNRPEFQLPSTLG